MLQELTGSGIVGTITGALGGIASAFVKYKTRKLEVEHEFRMTELNQLHEISLHKAEVQKVQIEGQIQQGLAEEASLQASYQHDAALGAELKGLATTPAQGWVLVIANALRMIMRPILTLGTFSFVMYVFGQYWVALSGVELLPVDQLLKMTNYLLMAVISIMTMAASWYFADRSTHKQLNARLPQA